MVLMTGQQHEGEELKPVKVINKKENKASLIHCSREKQELRMENSHHGEDFAAFSENENGTEEKRKSRKLSTVVTQTPVTDVEYFEDHKKISASRLKTIVDNTILAADGKNNSKLERKKHASNKFKSNAHFHKLFLDIPIDEPLRQSFTCALQKEIVYQGRLFISENWICFHSKVFGKDTKISIPVPSVTLLKKTKTALLVPNALVISTVSDRLGEHKCCQPKWIFVFHLLHGTRVSFSYTCCFVCCYRDSPWVCHLMKVFHGGFLHLQLICTRFMCKKDTAYKLLKAVCWHLEDVSVGNSPNPSSLGNSFRADRPTTLPLDSSGDYSELHGIIQQRRQEMEESSSTGSQTPELEHFQDYHAVDTKTYLKASKVETPLLRSGVHSRCLYDGKVQNVTCNVPPRILGFFYRMNYQKFLSVNHILALYAVLYKIHLLEEQLGSMASFVDSHINRHITQEDFESHLHLNVAGLCKELMANLIKLEKIQSNLQRLLEDSG